MSINHGSKNNELSDTLVTFLGKNINLAHIKLISLFVVALCKAKTVCFSLLSTVFDSPAKSSSCLRRIQRVGYALMPTVRQCKQVCIALT